MEHRSKMDGIKRVNVRWAFGPDGEYRYEHGTLTVVHDTKHVAYRKNGTWTGTTYDTGSYQSRHGPHNRYPGSIFMATTFGVGKENLMSWVRPWGSSWSGHCFYYGQYDSVGEENVNCHRCKKILAHQTSLRDTIIWIDCDLGVIRKWRMGDGEYYASACYETIRLNPPLARREFEIPSEAIRKSDPLDSHWAHQ